MTGLAMDEFLKFMAATTPIVLGVLTYYTAKANANAVAASKKAEHTALVANDNAQQAARATERVELTLAESTGVTTVRLGEIHTLVNSRLTEALKKIDQLESRLYVVTGEAPTGEPPATA